jgi:translocation and assembly module TamB
LVLPAEKVIDRVQISPELCNSWLKFVAPLLADATQIDGQFSLDLAGGSLPLAKLTSGELGGALGVHHAKVRPGATALQILGVIEQIKSVIERKPVGNAPRDRIWMQMPEQAISFRMTGGRVHHQNATFTIGDGTVMSSGSVGLDETIDLVLQIPIQDDWLKDEKLLSGLKGKSLKVPVRGTLGRPQVDSRVLTELATQIGGTALEGVIENQLDDLFKGKLKKFLPGQD